MKELEINKLTIVDDKGNPKIYFDGGSNDGSANVTFMSKNRSTLSIGVDPDQVLFASMHYPGGNTAFSIVLRSDEVGFMICNSTGVPILLFSESEGLQMLQKPK